MTKNGKKLLDYIVKNIGIKSTPTLNCYRSIPVCILDDIYSLQSKYEAITIPALNRYANHFLNGNLYTDDYLVDDFISDLDTEGHSTVSEKILKNKQRIAKRSKIDVCYDVATTLKGLSIQTFNDFNSYKNKDILSGRLKSIKGVGDAAVNYLFMLIGDENRVKPDIHIHHCIKDAIGHNVSNNMCQVLFKEVSCELMKKKSFATPRFLDHLVWCYYSKRVV